MRIFTRSGNEWISQSIDEYWLGKVLTFTFISGGIIGIISWLAAGFDPTWADPFANWVEVWLLPILRIVAPLAIAGIGVWLVFWMRAVGSLFPSLIFAMVSCILGAGSALLVSLPMPEDLSNFVTLLDFLWAGGVIIILAGIPLGIVAAISLRSSYTLAMILPVLLLLFLTLFVINDFSSHYFATEVGSLSWLYVTLVLALGAWRARDARQRRTATIEK